MVDKSVFKEPGVVSARVPRRPRRQAATALARAEAKSASVNGSQSVHRAFSLLRLVASARSEGMRLNGIAAATGLHPATAHRLLGALTRERFVTFDPYSRLYHIGHEFLALGEGAWEHRICEHYRPVLEQVADATEDTAYLSIVSGMDAVCIDRVEGRYPIRALTLDVGARRPLGVGGGSLALLAALSNEGIDAALAANRARYPSYNGMSAEEVRSLVRGVRRQGFAFNDGRVIEGVSAVALPVLNRHGSPIAAISVAAIATRMKKDRRHEIVALLKAAIAAVEAPLDHNVMTRG